MGRLIDADKFISWLDCGHLRNPSEKCLSELNVKKMIDNQPTAYDVDKVVEQLSLSEFDLDEKPHVVLNEVISIVKGAVKDE
ncbi:MAG TPA: hypothetical protein VFD00_11850 [Thermoclostridium sp.]|nr:hypothetical protein [Thermoclostridium sp.]